MMQRSTKIIVLLMAVAIIAVGTITLIGWSLVKSKERRIETLVTDCGGRMATYSGWLLATDYQVIFPGPLNSTQLEQLQELNSLRGEVQVILVNCDLSDNEARELTSKLGECHLYQVPKGGYTPMRIHSANEP